MNPVFHPKISVILPVYNGEKYLKEAIDSLLVQTYDNYEIIVVNDGSSDNSEEIILSYGDKLRYYAKENGGQSSALNHGIDRMTGDYACWIGQDDLYYPDRLETHVNVLKGLDNKETVLYGAYTIIDENGDRKGSVTFEQESKLHPSWCFMAVKPIQGQSALVPKRAIDRIGKFNEKRPHTHDMEMFFNLSLVYPFHYVPEELLYSRSHAGQATYRKYSYHIYECNLLEIDHLSKLANKELEKISGMSAIQALSFFAMMMGKTGAGIARKVALSRLRFTTNVSHKKYYTVKLWSYRALAMKKIKIFLKKIIYNYGQEPLVR